MGLLNRPFWEDCPPIFTQSEGRFIIPNDGEWWAIDRALVCLDMHSAAQYTGGGGGDTLLSLDKPHQIMEK